MKIKNLFMFVIKIKGNFIIKKKKQKRLYKIVFDHMILLLRAAVPNG